MENKEIIECLLEIKENSELISGTHSEAINQAIEILKNIQNINFMSNISENINEIKSKLENIVLIKSDNKYTELKALYDKYKKNLQSQLEIALEFGHTHGYYANSSWYRTKLDWDKYSEKMNFIGGQEDNQEANSNACPCPSSQEKQNQTEVEKLKTEIEEMKNHIDYLNKNIAQFQKDKEELEAKLKVSDELFKNTDLERMELIETRNELEHTLGLATTENFKLRKQVENLTSNFDNEVHNKSIVALLFGYESAKDRISWEMTEKSWKEDND